MPSPDTSNAELRAFIEGDGSYVQTRRRSTVTTIADLLSAMDGLNRADRYVEVLRVAKVFEEAGEAIQALIAYHDVNPRKEAGPISDVIKELCDVALSAKIAVENFGFDAEWQLALREDDVLQRLRAKADASSREERG